MNRKHLIRSVAAVVLIIPLTLVTAGTNEKFDTIKSLAGEWQGTKPDGENVKVTYEVVSNGSVVMERLESESEPVMITMYHLDGDHLMMTHYCSAKNQPRMRAAMSNEDQVIRFSFYDVTNLVKPTDGHMQKLIVTLKDKDHLVTQWTFVEDGKEHSAPFELERKP